MIESRNMTFHTCKEETAEQICREIKEKYLSEFQALRETLSGQK